jgi:formyltetrahydrofolate-dependent phosphoribosylglycinamide formyltransferase
MFDRLQKKWKVNGLQLALILCTFAIGGSLTGYVGRKLMNIFAIEHRALWILVYIILVTLLWPLAVILISIPFGQFRFFRHYLRKIGSRIGLVSSQSGASVHRPEPARKSNIQHSTYNIAIFASGAGSNAQRIIDFFRDSTEVRVALIVCNKPGAGVLKIAETEKIPALLIEKEQFFRGNAYVDELKKSGIDFIVLAGFLWKIPALLVKAYAGRMVNIHPALLPKYGGKGMYGAFVHEAVIAAGDKESGITIHHVDEHYDHGSAIFQARCEVLPDDTPGKLAERIHNLEHEHYPRVIAELLRKADKLTD